MTELSPPDIGQPNWGPELNAYLIATEAQTVLNEARIDALEARAATTELRLTQLEGQVAIMEDSSDRVYSSGPWIFKNELPPAASSGNQTQVRFDNLDPTLATLIDFRRIDCDGADRTSWFQMLDAGSLIRLQDWDNSNIFQRFHVLGPVAFPDATNTHVSVVWEAGSGVLPNAKVSVGFLVELKI